VVIVSDSRTEKDDYSGDFLVKSLENNGHKVLSRCLLKNDAGLVRSKLNELLGDDKLQVIIISGGTGVSRRDVTVETVAPMLDKQMDGFGELFRRLSYEEIKTGCIMSRALAGVKDGRMIICLPGSLGAVTLAVEQIILPEMGHMVREASR
jgi:molybdenum cofactor biosynthesis protein B